MRQVLVKQGASASHEALQLIQADAPGSENVPGGHGVHIVAPVIEYDPAAHCMHPDESVYVPAGHVTHDDAPGSDTLPALHGVHIAAPVKEYDPAAHCMHPEIDAYVPAEQLVHCDA
jgi:hypothetical protein